MLLEILDYIKYKIINYTNIWFQINLTGTADYIITIYIIL